MSKHDFDFSKENSWIFIPRLEAARKKVSKMFNKEIKLDPPLLNHFNSTSHWNSMRYWEQRMEVTDPIHHSPIV